MLFDFLTREKKEKKIEKTNGDSLQKELTTLYLDYLGNLKYTSSQEIKKSNNEVFKTNEVEDIIFSLGFKNSENLQERKKQEEIRLAT